VIVCRKEFLATLPKALYTTMLSNHYKYPCVYFDKPEFEEFGGILRGLEDELMAADDLAAEVIGNYMSLLLAKYLRRGAANALTQHHARDDRHLGHYHAFCSLLDASPIDARQPVTFYASRMGLSTKTLNDSIRKASGKTCVALLQDRLLTEVKRRLLYTSESCKEIAYDLAFRDCSYFTRFFKKLEGMTPMEFKTQWEEKYQHRA
jgi:AraC-like DNA-binding protein